MLDRHRKWQSPASEPLWFPVRTFPVPVSPVIKIEAAATSSESKKKGRALRALPLYCTDVNLQPRS